ncbi:MAG: ZIP family metal transporter, partial [Gammaproteobacteria bacterium]
MATDTILETIRSFSNGQWTAFKSTTWYKRYQSLPSVQRYLTLAGLFLGSQAIIFGLLYLFFGEIVVVGFFASILAGL